MSFKNDLDTFLQKYSQQADIPDNLTDREEGLVRSCINILNRAIKKRRKDPKQQKPDRKTRRLAKLTEMQKKKFAEKQFVFQQDIEDSDESNQKRCYICKGPMKDETRHFFYDSMCSSCGDLNYTMRNKTRDLTGMTAIVTGARIKIGYQIALWLLNNGCYVIATTRFPADALLRFQKEPNYEQFKDRLFLYGLDFRNLKKVHQFIEFIYQNYKEVNILINNAAQTLYRTDDYNHQLEEDEQAALKAIQEDPKNKMKLEENSAVSLVQNTFNLENNQQLELFQSNYSVYDANHAPVDFSLKNSWTKQIDEIDFREFAEAQVINSWVPFILCSNLKKILTVPNKKSFVINVSAMEGKFDYPNKTSAHPHNNMAKAALNMLTRTCGRNFQKSGIYMTSVDTGWCSEMVPTQMYSLKRTVPLDEIDGAMRVLHPIFDNLDSHSVLLKDYKTTTW